MAEGFVMPLSGEEIITDILNQVERKLRTDCNLRGVDAYSGGYSGTIKLNLYLHAVDIVPVEMEVPVSGKAVEGDAPVGEEITVDETIQIEREPNLEEVRERSGQTTPPSVSTPESQQAPKRRNYSRVVAGAALDEKI